MASKKDSRAAKTPKSPAKTGARTARGAEPVNTKTTHPEASKRRQVVAPGPPVERRKKSEARRTDRRREALPQQVAGRKLDAIPDRIDIRDWVYHPSLRALPDLVVNCDYVPKVLDQGQEGACTGFALAGVINTLLNLKHLERFVSPFMLYEMARHYDEWPGEDYEGSSARGCMKGWVRHGVCLEEEWPKSTSRKRGSGPAWLDAKIGAAALKTPGGAFYRVDHRSVRDVHAAINEVGAVYITLMVHGGWQDPGVDADGKRKEPVAVHYVDTGTSRRIDLPIICRVGRATSGHAVALVGYTSDGFVVLNSWGPDWGERGFALLPYEDYSMHVTDVWVAQIGVPVTTNLWRSGFTDTTAGVARASDVIPLADLRPFIVDVGNGGLLSDSGNYWTTEADIDHMLNVAIPEKTAGWKKRRILLYLHGGLNDEVSVARRVVAFRDVMLANQIYPIHIMWESGMMESLRNLLANVLTDPADRAGGVRDWLRKFRDGVVEAKDRSLELTLARPGGALWSEMKKNAALASERTDGKGGMQILARLAKKAVESAAAGGDLELHVVGHSAGSNFAAHALKIFLDSKLPFKTLQFMAPAISVEEFTDLVAPNIGKGCPTPTLYVLSDEGERDDTVGPYGKSLLYLVSNAFEGRQATPLLGMEWFLVPVRDGKGTVLNEGFYDPKVSALVTGKVDGRPVLVVSGADAGPGSRSQSDSHGGFDNDPATLNSVLTRILGGDPPEPFKLRDLQY